jgi:hypothetical protein
LSTISKTYLKEVRRNLIPYISHWEPDTIVEVGDYGYYANGIGFIKLGNIRNLGILYELSREDSDTKREFCSNDSISITPYVKGQIKEIANASLKINFGKSKGVFFNAAGCSFITFQNYEDIKKKIEDCYELKHGWEKKHYLVTDVIYARNTTIAISSSKNAEIQFESTLPQLGSINLNDIELSLRTINSRNIGYCLETKKGLTLLLRLGKIYVKPILRKRFGPIIFGSFKMENVQNSKPFYFDKLG